VPVKAFLLSDQLLLARRIVGGGPPRWQVHARVNLARASCQDVVSQQEDAAERVGDARFALAVDEGSGTAPLLLLMPSQRGPESPVQAPVVGRPPPPRAAALSGA
jgi:hypothetical protein